MDKNFLSDQPVSNQGEDHFQRYGFAKRIATTIIERDNEDCIVIGVYGAWGEGKTSVINFIENELKGTENIISVKFNPWRYSDENALLIQFFEKLANILDTNLKNDKEKIGVFLKKYGKLLTFNLPIVGNLGGAIQSAGDVLEHTDVETLKNRIGEILKASKSKVVVFIDDIDRLDKTEVHSIFRLIKLVADFPNTIYILAFDEEMVSSAIGERFGEGSQKAGQIFLEKIIQVPLEIPVAQPEALQKFCFTIINNALNSNKILLTEEEKRRFVSEFTNNILLKLTTPRLAVRYGNSLSFSMPLLFGEVNIVDLMLIEAIKIFYPSHYQFIKSNPEYFIGSYQEPFSRQKDKDKMKQITDHLDELSKDLTKKQKKCIQDLVGELFPLIKGIFNNTTYHSDIQNSWYKSMRIASPKYFSRYFSYAVIEGEISDVVFKDFIAKIPTQSLDEVINSLRIIVTQSSPEHFINKIRSIEDDLEWTVSSTIAKAIAEASEIFPQPNTFTMGLGFEAPYGQAAMFIYSIIKNHSNKDAQFELAKELMSEAKPFQFACDINSWLRSGDTAEKKIFSTTQYVELAKILVNRALLEAGNIPIFEKFPNQMLYLCKAWAAYDKAEFTKYIKSILKKKPNKSMDLLRAFTPTGFSSAIIGPTKFDFTKEQYQLFASLFDKNVINAALNTLFTEDDLNSAEVKWESTDDGEHQTDLNIVRQFRHWLKMNDNITGSNEITSPSA